MGRVLTFRVQQLGEAQVLLGQVEGVLQVVVSVGLLQLVKVDQIGSEQKTQNFIYNNANAALKTNKVSR